MDHQHHFHQALHASSLHPDFPEAFFSLCSVCIALVTVLYRVGYILTGFLIFRPLALNWNKNLNGHCGNTSIQEIGSAIINMILDLTTVVLPMPVLWTLQGAWKYEVLASRDPSTSCIKIARCLARLSYAPRKFSIGQSQIPLNKIS